MCNSTSNNSVYRKGKQNFNPAICLEQLSELMVSWSMMWTEPWILLMSSLSDVLSIQQYSLLNGIQKMVSSP